LGIIYKKSCFRLKEKEDRYFIVDPPKEKWEWRRRKAEIEKNRGRGKNAENDTTTSVSTGVVIFGVTGLIA
jgi:hypothetical protein